MRDITVCHPKLQKLAKKLVKECAKKGIDIKIGECLRTVAEQDKLYSYGRIDMSRGKVTNAKGSTYSSLHIWGIAFDIYLVEDVDGDGSTSDDAYNNKTKLFNQVGKIGQKLGLEWGGSWVSICDMPHFQLPDWGSTATLLKKKYGTPDKFIKTWKK